MGFYGDWYGCQRIIDPPARDDNIMTGDYFNENLPVTTVAAGDSRRLRHREHDHRL